MLKIKQITDMEQILSGIKHCYIPDRAFDGQTMRELKKEKIIRRHSTGYGWVVEGGGLLRDFFIQRELRDKLRGLKTSITKEV